MRLEVRVTSFLVACRWLHHLGDANGFPEDLAFLKPVVVVICVRAHALKLLEGCILQVDADWLDFLGYHTDYKVGACLAAHRLVTEALISHLTKCA